MTLIKSQIIDAIAEQKGIPRWYSNHVDVMGLPSILMGTCRPAILKSSPSFFKNFSKLSNILSAFVVHRHDKI